MVQGCLRGDDSVSYLYMSSRYQEHIKVVGNVEACCELTGAPCSVLQHATDLEQTDVSMDLPV